MLFFFLTSCLVPRLLQGSPHLPSILGETQLRPKERLGGGLQVLAAGGGGSQCAVGLWAQACIWDTKLVTCVDREMQSSMSAKESLQEEAL